MRQWFRIQGQACCCALCWVLNFGRHVQLIFRNVCCRKFCKFALLFWSLVSVIFKNGVIGRYETALSNIKGCEAELRNPVENYMHTWISSWKIHYITRTYIVYKLENLVELWVIVKFRSWDRVYYQQACSHPGILLRYVSSRFLSNSLIKCTQWCRVHEYLHRPQYRSPDPFRIFIESSSYGTARE